MTEKQEDFIYLMLEKLGTYPEDYDIDIDNLSIQDASDLIEELKFELNWD